MKSVTADTDKVGRIIFPADTDENNFDAFLNILDGRLSERPREIVLDCSLLGEITSTIINLLWQIRIKCDKSKIPLKLDSVSDKLSRVLQVLDLYDLFLGHPKSSIDEVESVKPESIRSGAKKHFLEFYPGINSIRNSLAEFKEYLADLNISKIPSFELETVFYEIATNIRLHGDVESNDIIKFAAIPEKDKIILEFEYPGLPFDPTAYKSEFDPIDGARQRKKRGYGLIMIKRMTDNILYQRINNDTNLLILEKCWGRNNG